MIAPLAFHGAPKPGTPRQHLRAKVEALGLYNSDNLLSYARKALEEVGVDYNAVIDAGYLVFPRNVDFVESGGFEYDELGEATICLVALGEDGETETDIVAFSAKHPAVFGTLLSRAVILGIDRVLNPATYAGDQACPMWRTPLRWLYEGCNGAVILQPIPAAVAIAKAPGKLAAEDLEHARELADSGAVRPDQLVVPADSIRAAA